MLQNDLRMILDKQGALFCCHKRTTLQKVEQNNHTLAFCEFLLWGSFLGLIFFVFPYINGDAWFPVLSLIFLTSQVFFVLTVKTDPGFMKRSKTVSFLRLVEKFDHNMLCPACEVICTADSKHCYVCNQCVERMDHHCQWVNNCIGINNHHYFYIYIVTQMIYLLSSICVCVFNINLWMSSETMEKAKSTFMFPQVLISDIDIAQIAYDSTIVISLLLTIVFMPFLSVLIYI